MDPEDVHGAPEGPYEVRLETGQRLSRSLLWQLQRGYFAEAGIDAWRTNTVPHYVTNNPALAHAYAEVFLGFLRDCAAAGPLREPVTIVELGAGSGRFAYLFLKALLEMHRSSSLAGVRFRYVMTDFTEANVRFWRAHEALSPLVSAGVLDFAVFDAERDGALALAHAGTTVGPGDLQHPLFVIANYVFDGISQDAFFFEGGALHECLITLSSREPAAAVADAGVLDRVRIDHERRAASLDYYEEAELNAILRGYAAREEARTILFPSAALRCLGRLSQLSGGRLLLLSGDRGGVREDAVGAPEDLGLTVHGSFSVPVNYHAIAAYVRGRGGDVLTTAHRQTHLHVAAFLLGERPAGYVEARLAYDRAIGHAGPDDFFSVRRGVQDGYERLDLPQLLSFIRLSLWDPRVLFGCLPALWPHLEAASDRERNEVVETVMRVWENYYHIGELLDLPFELGSLLHHLGAHAEALLLFQASLQLYGPDPATSWNVGLCHYGTGNVTEAMRCFEETARRWPRFSPTGPAQIKAPRPGP